MIGAGPIAPRCSRAGCAAEATVAIRWRNPRIHPEGREKTWLACGDHAETLRVFLADRDFPLRVEPFTAEVAG